jgi:hypothetical protein
MKLKMCIFCALGLLITSVNAMSSTAGINCTTQSVVFQNGVVVLNSRNVVRPLVYQFQNIAGQTVQLNHSTGGGMQAGYASNIDPDHMTAILINKNSFFFSCAFLNAQEIPRAVDCSKVIEACEMKNIIYPADPSMLQGQYWIVENQAVNSFNNALAQRGFVPKEQS